MAKTKMLTIPQYTKQVKNVSRQAILKAVKNNKKHLLPGVINITKPGRDYFLEVPV
jgi:hypothetical protein